MPSAPLRVLIVAGAIVLVLLLVRRGFARRGAGRLAQLHFRARHGAQVAQLLEGQLDPTPGSPWIEWHLDGRPARLVAAPVAGHMQAGIELAAWEIPVQVWFTNGDPAELEVPAGIDPDRVLAVVARLRDADVEGVSNAELGSGAPHVLRLQFDDVAELPGRVERIAPLLRELEALAPTLP